MVIHNTWLKIQWVILLHTRSSEIGAKRAEKSLCSRTCRMTQWPSLAARSMHCSATISWPWPRDTLWKFFTSKVKPSFLPRASTSFRGSTPGERMKKTGVAGSDSSYESANGTCPPSTYLLPSFSSMKFLFMTSKNSYFNVNCIVLGQLPTRKIPYQMIIKPNYCLPGTLSIGQLPNRTPTHQDHCQPVSHSSGLVQWELPWWRVVWIQNCM